MARTTLPANVVGTTIDGKYRVDSLLGQGGMGKVFKVTHLQLNKIFALKLMDFEPSAQDAMHVLRFKREAEALAKITHPNIVMVTDFGVLPNEQAPYIVMEYIDGVTLRQLLSTPGKFTERQALQIAKQLCAGLHEAHQQGIVHRDLKPENVMVQQFADGELLARILDFGIAKLTKKSSDGVDNLTGKDIPGTLKYMAPEQLLDQPIDARCDVFGIALIIYEILTGTVAAVMVSKVKPITQLRPDVSERFSEIILKSLSHSPDERPQSALELKRELEAYEQVSSSNATSNNINAAISNATLIHSGPSMDKGTSAQNRNKTSVMQRASDGNLALEPTVILTDPAPRKSWPIVAVLLVIVLAGGGIFGWRYYVEERAKNEKPKIENAAMPKMMSIKGGKFIMGNDKGLDAYAKPEHSVTLAPFQVSKFLVTNRQYAEFVKLTGYRPPQNWNGQISPGADILEKPVTFVTWRDARNYCNWLTQQTGRAFRLPTEEEWEYMARNQKTLEVEEILGTLLEWTDSEFMLYPGAKISHPSPNIKMRSYRGDDGSKESKNSPTTYRGGNHEDYAYGDLGFRVACNEDGK